MARGRVKMWRCCRLLPRLVSPSVRVVLIASAFFLLKGLVLIFPKCLMVIWLWWQENGEKKGKGEELPQVSVEAIVCYDIKLCGFFYKRKTLIIFHSCVAVAEGRHAWTGKAPQGSS